MKRIIALILALVMTMALVACGGDKPASSTPTNPDTPSNPTASTPGTTNPGTSTDKPAEDPDAWKYGGDMVIGTGNAWTSFAPHQDSVSSLGNKYMAAHCIEGLALKDINGKTYPQVCDVTESADGLTVTVKLRERYFSNGDKITMEDVLASIQRGAALLTESSFKKQWNGVTMKVEGDTIIFTLEKFNVEFFRGLVSDGTRYRVLPKEICDKYPVTGGELQPCGLVMGGTAPNIDKVEDLIGSGPYKLTKYTEEEFTLSRNENYTAIENDAVGIAAPARCYLDTITFQLNKDAASRTAATMAGDYHIGSVSNEMVEQAKAMGVKVDKAGTTWTHGIFFNLDASNSDSPVYNVNVRKAIRAILDVDAIMLSICGGDKNKIDYPLTPTPVVKENTAYHNTMLVDSGEWNIKDADKAKAYLAAANYDGTPIVYLTHASGAFYNAAMVIIPMMESIGLKVELMAVDNGSHSALRKDPKTGHDIGCWEVQKWLDSPLHSTFVAGTQGWWDHPVRTETIETMKNKPLNSAESVAAYEKYTQLVIDECPYILFGNPTGTVAYRENVVRASVGQLNYYYWNDSFTDNKK